MVAFNVSVPMWAQKFLLRSMAAVHLFLGAYFFMLHRPVENRSFLFPLDTRGIFI